MQSTNCAVLNITDSNFSEINWGNSENIKFTELEIYGYNQISVNLNNKIFQKSLKNITSLLCRDFILINITNLNTGIELISFYNLSMRNIELHYLKKLIKLKHLTIHLNYFNIIKNFTFEDLKKLEYLTLTNNNITNIESSSFKGLYSLLVLNLNFNAILELHIDTFKIMDQSGNYLAKTIININLRKSKLKVIKSRLFVFDAMESIDLSYNLITDIEKNAFSIKNIQYLNLQGNKLSSIDEYVFHTINITLFLAIYGNKIICNCNLQWIERHTKMLEHLNYFLNENIKCNKYEQLLTSYIENSKCKGIYMM